MARVSDSFEWTCQGCGIKYRVDVERVEANNVFRTTFMNVKCVCGGDNAHRAEFSDTRELRVTNRPPGSWIMGIL